MECRHVVPEMEYFKRLKKEKKREKKAHEPSLLKTSCVSFFLVSSKISAVFLIKDHEKTCETENHLGFQEKKSGAQHQIESRVTES